MGKMEGLGECWIVDQKNLVWEQWNQEIILFTELNLGDRWENEGKAFFTFSLGEKGQVSKTLLPRIMPKTLEQQIKWLNSVTPRQNETVERYYLFTWSQEAEEGLDTYITEPRKLVSVKVGRQIP